MPEIITNNETIDLRLTQLSNGAGNEFLTKVTNSLAKAATFWEMLENIICVFADYIIHSGEAARQHIKHLSQSLLQWSQDVYEIGLDQMSAATLNFFAIVWVAAEYFAALIPQLPSLGYNSQRSSSVVVGRRFVTFAMRITKQMIAFGSPLYQTTISRLDFQEQ